MTLYLYHTNRKTGPCLISQLFLLRKVDISFHARALAMSNTVLYVHDHLVITNVMEVLNGAI